MSFDSDLVLFLITQEHDGYRKLFFLLFFFNRYNILISTQLWDFRFYLVPAYMSGTNVQKTVEAQRLLWVKVVPAVNVLWLSVSHSMERDMTLNQLTDSTQTLTSALSFSSNYGQKNKILKKIKRSFSCGL